MPRRWISRNHNAIIYSKCLESWGQCHYDCGTSKTKQRLLVLALYSLSPCQKLQVPFSAIASLTGGNSDSAHIWSGTYISPWYDLKKKAKIHPKQPGLCWVIHRCQNKATFRVKSYITSDVATTWQSVTVFGHAYFEKTEMLFFFKEFGTRTHMSWQYFSEFRCMLGSLDRL